MLKYWLVRAFEFSIKRSPRKLAAEMGSHEKPMCPRGLREANAQDASEAIENGTTLLPKRANCELWRAKLQDSNSSPTPKASPVISLEASTRHKDPIKSYIVSWVLDTPWKIFNLDLITVLPGSAVNFFLHIAILFHSLIFFFFHSPFGVNQGDAEVHREKSGF